MCACLHPHMSSYESVCARSFTDVHTLTLCLCTRLYGRHSSQPRAPQSFLLTDESLRAEELLPSCDPTYLSPLTTSPSVLSSIPPSPSPSSPSHLLLVPPHVALLQGGKAWRVYEAQHGAAVMMPEMETRSGWMNGWTDGWREGEGTAGGRGRNMRWSRA